MPLPKLSPLQSRFAASLIASIMLLILYLVFTLPNLAYAADVDSTRAQDHNHERILDMDILGANVENLDLRSEAGYEAEFIGYDRGIIGRAPTANSPTQLTNNVARTDNIVQGQTFSYVFPSAEIGLQSRSTEDGMEQARLVKESDEGEDFEDLKLRPRQSRTVYISVNTCLQPRPIHNTTIEPPPQLQLYISQSESNPNPGPNSDGVQEMVMLDGGAVMKTVSVTGDLFMGVYGVNTTAYQDVWNAEIAVSTDGFYHTFYNNSDPNLQLIDSDSSAALLVTGNLTNEDVSSSAYQAVLNAAPPYVLFATDSNERPIQGLQNSYCGLMQNAGIVPSTTGQSASNIDTSLTTRGNGAPKQQFYLTGIKGGTTYSAILAMYGGRNSTTGGSGVVGGGGQVWPMMNFTTLSGMFLHGAFSNRQELTFQDGNCAVVFNLSFCDQTAYAVPGNPNNFPNMTSLASFYDNGASQYYQNFQNVLAQIPCNTTSTAQYSLARNCDDCAAAYKAWLCSVYIPRCTDFSSDLPWLRPRSMIHPFPNGTMLPPEVVSVANQSAFLSSSRNPMIDQYVNPGPYKEILPCDDLCYNIVQSCPSSMSFGCPLPGRTSFNQSYGIKSKTQVTCNYPGPNYDQITSGSGTIMPHLLMFVALVVMSLVAV
jgi:calcium channel MID1